MSISMYLIFMEKVLIKRVSDRLGSPLQTSIYDKGESLLEFINNKLNHYIQKSIQSEKLFKHPIKKKYIHRFTQNLKLNIN